MVNMILKGWKSASQEGKGKGKTSQRKELKNQRVKISKPLRIDGGPQSSPHPGECDETKNSYSHVKV